MNNELTEWFPPEVLPVRVGLYQRNWGSQHLIDEADYFDGKDWHVVEMNGEIGRVINMDLRWRGLAKEPPQVTILSTDTDVAEDRIELEVALSPELAAEVDRQLDDIISPPRKPGIVERVLQAILRLIDGAKK